MRRFPTFLFPPLRLAAWLFLFPAAFLAAQSESDWGQPGDAIEETRGRGLALRSDPPGAKVFIDGVERGETPLRLENLRAGEYFAAMRKEGYAERRFRVSVKAGSLTEISAKLKRAAGRALLRIRGDGPGPLLDPRISVDGRPRPLSESEPLSESGLPVLELPVGFRTIQVRAFGWEDFSETFYIEDGSFQELELNLKPARFRLSNPRLSRPRFNPASSGSLGTTVFNFEAAAPGTGRLVARDAAGKTVFAKELGPFETRAQSAAWDGRNGEGEILDDGVYALTIEARPLSRDDPAPAEESLVRIVELDSSRAIYPLAVSSGKSGLLFAPLPEPLPDGSFQIEGILLAGEPPESGGPWKSLPFSAGFRFSPLKSLEISAAMNVVPVFEKAAKAGISGAAKWAFFDSGAGGFSAARAAFRAAAGAAVSWTGKTGLTPFGMASGVELFFPLSLDLGDSFSFALAPAALWTGDEGFPWDPAPRLLVSGGLLMRLASVSAGLSARAEYDFSKAPGELWPPPLMAGCEVKIFPPPSSFAVSVMGGIWKRDGDGGVFGGAGIGMIY